MKIVASNSITVSKVDDGTITHTAWSYSANGTDRFTTVYPNLNLLKGSRTYSKSNPYVLTGDLEYIQVHDLHHWTRGGHKWYN